jgi:hypothetical protein
MEVVSNSLGQSIKIGISGAFDNFNKDLEINSHLTPWILEANDS